MKKNKAIKLTIISLFIITSLVILFLSEIYSNKNNVITIDKKVKATDFSFIDMENKKYKLYDFNNNNIIIHFWASWCEVCVTEMNSLLNYAEKKQYKLIMISIDESLADMKDFVYKNQYNKNKEILWVWDHDSLISKNIFGVYKTPESIIIDKEMNFVKKIIGSFQWNNL